MAQHLGHGFGHGRFDWVAILDPVAPEQQTCWRKLGHTLQAEQLGQAPLLPGQRLASRGLALHAIAPQGRRWLIQAGTKQFNLELSRLRLRALMPPRPDRYSALVP